MHDRWKGRAVAAALLLSTAGLEAQETAASSDADRVWRRYVTALGGQAWHDVRTREIQGSLEYRGTQQHGTGAFSMRWKAPRSFVEELRHPLGSVVRGLNGSRAWGEHPQAGVRQISQMEVDEILLEAALYQPLGVRHWYTTLAYEGRTTVDGREAEMLSARRHGKTLDRFYFDVVTGLPIRLDVWEEGPEGVRIPSPEHAYLAHFDLGDYRKVGGVAVPFLIRRRRPNSTSTLRFTTVRHNVSLPDSLFRAR